MPGPGGDAALVATGGPRPAALAAGERALLVLLVVAHLAAVWVPRWFPSQDGPIHLEIAAVLSQLSTTPSALVDRYFELNPRPAQPNWLIYPPLVALSSFAPGPVAEKILLSVYVVAFPLALLYFLRVVRPEGSYAVFLGLPLILNFPLHMGFYNFCFGLVAYLATVGFWLRRRRRLTAGATLALVGLFLLAYAAHAVAWGMVGVTAAAVLLWELAAGPAAGRRELLLRQAPPTLLAAVPELLLMIGFVDQQWGGGVERLPVRALVKHLALGYSLVSFSRWELVFSVALVVTLAALAIAALVARSRSGGSVRGPGDGVAADGLLVAAVGTVALYCVLPLGLLGGGYLNQRLQLFIPLLAIGWLAGQPAIDRVRRPVVVVATAIACGFLALHVVSYRRLDRDLGEYLSAASAIEPGTTLLTLSFANRGPAGPGGEPPSWKVRPFEHAGGRLAVDRGLVDLDDYQADQGYFPVRYRAACDPFARDRGGGDPEAEPPHFDVAAYRSRPGCEVDQVLVWGAGPAELARVAAGLGDGYDEVYVSPTGPGQGLVRLFRRRGLRAPPPGISSTP